MIHLERDVLFLPLISSQNPPKRAVTADEIEWLRPSRNCVDSEGDNTCLAGPAAEFSNEFALPEGGRLTLMKWGGRVPAPGPVRRIRAPGVGQSGPGTAACEARGPAR